VITGQDGGPCMARGRPTGISNPALPVPPAGAGAGRFP